VLYYIKERLNCGSVTVSNERASSKFSISSAIQIKTILIPILDSHPLNTTKFLDYNLFKHVLEMYLDKKHLTSEGLIEIKSYLNSLNNKINYFTMPVNHSIKVSTYWLLGFIEAEGNFQLSKINSNNIKENQSNYKFQAQMTISLTEIQRPVLNSFNKTIHI
jgi:hypothetical protein